MADTFEDPPTAAEVAAIFKAGFNGKAQPIRRADARYMRHELNHGSNQVFCVNGHGVGDARKLSALPKRCVKCDVTMPWLYRWEVE